MSKIGIITLVGYFNYGNRLQNYALYKVLSMFGNNVVTIETQNKSRINYLKSLIFERKNNKLCFKKMADIKKERALKKFTEKYIPTEAFDDYTSLFDYYIVGSDQVWNPLFWGNNTRGGEPAKYLLKNIPGQKRIAYAASFGVSELPEMWKGVFSKELSEFKRISVRENDGVEIVSSLCDISPNVVLDPTMLLDAHEWRKIMRGRNISKEYLLLFFLGDIDSSKREFFTKVAKEYKLEIIEMSNSRSKYYYVDPIGFLDLIENASFVFTDSFHATVFSILFETKFVVYDRQQNNYGKMNSRILTLLNTFSLSERYEMYDISEINKFDLSNTKKLLIKEREKSLMFLKESIELNFKTKTI